MSRRLIWILIILLGLGALLLKTMPQLNTPAVTSLVVTGIGIFVLAAGVQTLRSKKIGFESKRANFGPTEVYRGLAAQLYGILFILFALLIFALVGVIWLYPGGIEAFLAAFFAQSWGWGVVITAIGLVAIVSGVIRLMAGSAGYYKGVADKVERISGLLPLLFGLLLGLIGLLLILVPDLLTGVFKQLFNSIWQKFSR